jgi:hypothetical protein
MGMKKGPRGGLSYFLTCRIIFPSIGLQIIFETVQDGMVFRVNSSGLGISWNPGVDL